MIWRSLNFWLFWLLLVCGFSFWLAKGPGLPAGTGFLEKKVVQAEDWQPEPGQQSVHLRILNGTGHSGLAREFSLLVAGQGCVVEGIGNASGSWARSLLVNRRLDSDQAGELAKRLGVAEVIRQWDERLTEDAVLILGNDFEDLRAVIAF